MDKFSLFLRYFILAVFVYLFFLIMKPFLPSVVIGAASAIIFFPVFEFLKKRSRLNNGLAAFFTVVLTVIFIFVPLLTLVSLVVSEAIKFSANFNAEYLAQVFESISNFSVFGYSVDIEALKASLISNLGKIGTFFAQYGGVILGGILNSLWAFLVFLLLYYYFLKDHEKLLGALKSILPYESKDQNKLVGGFKEITRTIFFGNLVTSLASGLIAYVGFLAFGFGTPLIWALIAMILSFIPTAGPLFLYLGAAVFMYFVNGLWVTLGFLAYFVVMELVLRENILKPKLLDDKLNFHPILVFFSLVGGVSAFGAFGLVYGPLIVTLLFSLWQFYAKEKAK